MDPRFIAPSNPRQQLDWALHWLHRGGSDRHQCPLCQHFDQHVTQRPLGRLNPLNVLRDWPQNSLNRFQTAMNRVNRSRKPSGRREDGAATRLQILEAAGEVFAEKGIGHATGKEIAERAGTNSAAVNYYFGGIDGLYSEVLVEAHHRLMDLNFLKQIADGPGSPSEKLNIFLEGMIRAILGPSSSSWALRVIGREMIHPSDALQTLLDREVLPKKEIAIRFVGEILGLPPDHPAVARSGLSIIGPIALLLVGSPGMLQHLAPQDAVANRVDDVVNHFQRFIRGGLSAIAEDLEGKTDIR